MGRQKTGPALRGDYSRAAVDYTVPQDWEAYSRGDHAVWRLLYQRQRQVLPRYAARAYLSALDGLDAGAGIPRLDVVSDALQRATGWWRYRGWCPMTFFSPISRAAVFL
jgi:phenylalanine-4-hydroxylase